MRAVTLLFCVLSAAFVPSVVSAQASSKAYAPRDLTVLNDADRTRVIEIEYQEQSGGRRIPDDQLEFYLNQINSGWKWTAIQEDIAQSLAGSGGWTAAPPPRPRPPVPVPQPLPSNGSIYGPGVVEIDCQSRKFRYTTCRTGVRGRFELVGQYGNSACIEGRTWGQAPGTLWVDKGCRARFIEVQYWTRPWRGGGIECGSDDGGRRECRLPFAGAVRVVQQVSRNACIEGRTWGQRQGWVWVTSGCRARFEVVGRGGDERYDERYDDRPHQGGGRYKEGAPFSVTCTSEGEYRTCAWDETQGPPVLIENLARQRCVEGQTWGYGRREGLWVDAGCQGRFGTQE